MESLKLLAAGVAVVALMGPALADPVNQPPPSGTVIYSLTGQTLQGTYQEGVASFVAGSTATNLAFALREDPAFIELSNVSMVNETTSSGNLVVNGNFSGGTYFVAGVGNEPDGWTYLNSFGASYGGEVIPDCGITGGNCYYDGAVQAYDAINQVIATTIGDTYEVTFDYLDTCPECLGGGEYQPTSTNGDVTNTGGNGRDMFVYAGASQPVRAVPEPASLTLFGAGVFLLGLRRRRKA